MVMNSSSHFWTRLNSVPSISFIEPTHLVPLRSSYIYIYYKLLVSCLTCYAPHEAVTFLHLQLRPFANAFPSFFVLPILFKFFVPPFELIFYLHTSSSVIYIAICFLFPTDCSAQVQAGGGGGLMEPRDSILAKRGHWLARREVNIMIPVSSVHGCLGTVSVLNWHTNWVLCQPMFAWVLFQSMVAWVLCQYSIDILPGYCVSPWLPGYCTLFLCPTFYWNILNWHIAWVLC